MVCSTEENLWNFHLFLSKTKVAYPKKSRFHATVPVLSRASASYEKKKSGLRNIINLHTYQELHFICILMMFIDR